MNKRMVFATVLALILGFSSISLLAGTNGETTKRKDNRGESVQRGKIELFDQQGNVVSNINFQTTNYGIFGYDVKNNRGGTFWPRGRNNQYIFAGGAWLGVRKKIGTQLRKRVMIGYNPNSGLSWMVPGSIEDGMNINTTTEAGITKYRIYFSPDFNSTDGTELLNPGYPRWPIWDSSPLDTVRYNNYYGYYINDPTARFKSTYPKGPAFISEEDVFCVYKDTDLSRYEGGVTKRKAEGFPLGIQVEQMIYSWGFGDYADFLFIKYLVIHPASFADTLFDCWMAAVQDVDIALITNANAGAGNDRARYYIEDPNLNLAVQWTNIDRLEAGQGFGYLGFNFLESPAVVRDTSLNAIYSSGSLNGFAVGNGGRMMSTTNGGQQWIRATNRTMTRANLFDVYFADANTGFVVGDSATIIKTTDGGRSWSEQQSRSASEFRGLHFLDANNGWVVGAAETTGNGVVLRTNDGGSTWSPQTIDTVAPLRSVSFADANTGWAVGNGGVIVATKDGGATWSVQTNPDTVNLNSVFAVSTQLAVAVGKAPILPGGQKVAPRLLRTDDGGTTWSRIELLLSDSLSELRDVWFADNQTGFIVGTNSLLYTSVDAGRSWDTTALDALGDLNSVMFSSPASGSIAGSSGRVLGVSTNPVEWNIQTQDTSGYLRKDLKQFPLSDQLGLRTMRNWPITEDPIDNEDRYNFITSGLLDDDNGPGDRRLMMATGPFNILPGDSARIVVGLILAPPVGTEASEEASNMTELVRKVKFAQFVYDNQFRAPRAPEIAVIRGAAKGSTSGLNSFLTIPVEGFLPLNNAVAFQWDSTSEMSIDTLERGLDFFGYRIYRARRTDLDTFDVDFRKTARKGPLGWKQIGQFNMTAPFVKDGMPIGVTGTRMDAFEIGDVIKTGQKKFMVVKAPSFVAPWANFYARLLITRPALYAIRINPTDSTIITTGVRAGLGIPNFDKFDSIRYTYFTTVIETLPLVRRRDTTIQGVHVSLPIASEAKIAKDSLVKLILARRVKMDPFLFNDVDTVVNDSGSASYLRVKRPWEETNEVRKGLVAPYMRSITSGRVFFDHGDDDRNGVITVTEDPATSEQLVNNIDYSYAIRSFDEGDYLLPSPQKLNNRAVGLSNVVTATPLASRPGNAVSFAFVQDEENRGKLGGIFNVRLLVKDQQRFNQMFGGKTLELQFFRSWGRFNPVANSTAPGTGLYGTVFFLRDSATKSILNSWESFLPPELCATSAVSGLPGYFSENSAVYVDSNGVFYDTVRSNSGEVIRIDRTTFGLPDSDSTRVRSGSFTSDAACFTNKYAYGTIGLAFDYSIEQWGGVYRTDTAFIVSGPANLPVSIGNLSAAVFDIINALNPPPAYEDSATVANFRRIWPTSYNNGPGIYELTFKERREENKEDVATQFEVAPNRDSTIVFKDVRYLTYEIRNVYAFNRADPRPDGTVGSVPVKYDFPLLPQTQDYTTTPPEALLKFPNPQPIIVGNYTGAAFGWRNSRTVDNYVPAMLRRLAAESNTGKPVGATNRYYISRTLSTGGGDTLDFTHVIAFAGGQFVLDFATMGRKTANSKVVTNAPSGKAPLGTYLPTAYAPRDFQPGDTVRLSTFGGAFGYPTDGARAYIRVANYDQLNATTGTQSYTNDHLEQVQVVPNPFYVTHEGMSSPFSSMIYFTRLPHVCTISIFSTNGALIKKFEHNETTGVTPDRYGADLWDLLSNNRQRVVSQLLIAKIETPEGASVIRKFAVVVGPARVIGE